MTTWTAVNLSWGPCPRFPERPERPFTAEMREWCGGKTLDEIRSEQSAKNQLIWKREGLDWDRDSFSKLSEDAKTEIWENNQVSQVLQARIDATPQVQAWQAQCDQIRADHENSFFKNRIKVGMLLEFEGGRRVLVGHINADGSVSGCCSEEIPDSDIVVRFCMIELPE